MVTQCSTQSFSLSVSHVTVYVLFQTAQLVYCILAAINDVFGTSTVVYSATSRLQRLRDVFFTALSLPVAMVSEICSAFVLQLSWYLIACMSPG